MARIFHTANLGFSVFKVHVCGVRKAKCAFSYSVLDTKDDLVNDVDANCCRLKVRFEVMTAWLDTREHARQRVADLHSLGMSERLAPLPRFRCAFGNPGRRPRINTREVHSHAAVAQRITLDVDEETFHHVAYQTRAPFGM